MSDVTIYHNPRCSKSRETLERIRQAGIEPAVVEYLKNPPSKDELRRLVADAGIPVRDLLRDGEAPYKDLGLQDPNRTDEQLLDAIVQHPILLNRPIVRTGKGVRLCRPPERVDELLA